MFFLIPCPIQKRSPTHEECWNCCLPGPCVHLIQLLSCAHAGHVKRVGRGPSLPFSLNSFFFKHNFYSFLRSYLHYAHPGSR
jgi:hypothetical protein